MPELEREDGVKIHWEGRGTGPVVFFTQIQWMTMPSNFAGLLDDLATDHRVVTWDPRGVGRSTRRGPYDAATDAVDMAALIESLGESVVLVSATPAAIRLAAERPDLVEALVLLGLGPLGPGESEAPVDSESMVEAALQFLRNDYRAGVRAAITMANSQASENEVRDRVEAQVAYCPQEAALPHAEEWLSGGEISHRGPLLGDRLWIVQQKDPLFPPEALESARKLMPEAHIVEPEDGAISRPDLTAEVVRAARRSR